MTRDLHRIVGVVPPVAGPVTLPPSEASVPDGEWLAYGRTRGGSHYSPLADIKPTNVAQLTKAWEYRTGEVRDANDPEETTYEVTPTVIDGLMYICTPRHVAIALDPVTGQEKWKYDVKVGQSTLRQHQTCRGLTYYRVDGVAATDACAARVLLPTSTAQLIALDAKTGQRCAEFGQDGIVDLWSGMPNRKEGSYYSTSPPAVARNLIIVGGAVNDNVSTREASGVIRAYDAKTGALVWNFDSGNPDKTAPITPGEQYVANSPNAWSILSVDADLGMVYAPMGNAPPDQFGGKRTPETERFSSSVVALDLASGRLQWVFQMVHHDLWDMDTPSQPQLVDVNTASGVVPALVQATKQGDIYVLDRRNGTAIVPVSNEPAPMGAAAGDHSAPQQPTSAMTFKPQPLAEKDMWGATPLDQLYCRDRLPQPQLRGALHATVDEGLDRLSRQFRHVQLGRRRRRSGAAGGDRQSGLSGVHGQADPARRRHDQLRVEAGAGLQRELRRAVRGDDAAVPLAPRPAVPAAAVGLCGGGGPRDGPDPLAAPQRHDARPVADPDPVRDGRSEHRRADRDGGAASPSIPARSTTMSAPST